MGVSRSYKKACINNVEDQLDATIKIYLYSNQLNMFREIFAPPQER